MNAIKRSTIVGLIVYAGFSLAGWCAVNGKLLAAYGVLFIVCIIATCVCKSNDKEVNE